MKGLNVVLVCLFSSTVLPFSASNIVSKTSRMPSPEIDFSVIDYYRNIDQNKSFTFLSLSMESFSGWVLSLFFEASHRLSSV
jgi:hypothetical protein